MCVLLNTSSYFTEAFLSNGAHSVDILSVDDPWKHFFEEIVHGQDRIKLPSSPLEAIKIAESMLVQDAAVRAINGDRIQDIVKRNPYPKVIITGKQQASSFSDKLRRVIR